MGFEKKYRPTVWAKAESLGSTAGTIGTWPPVTVITATATGLVYTLPTPQSGLQKTIVVDYNGATGNLTLANASTGTVFNGSTANVITVSSSESHLNVQLTGVTTAQWSSITSTGAGVSFAASTVTG